MRTTRSSRRIREESRIWIKIQLPGCCLRYMINHTRADHKSRTDAVVVTRNLRRYLGRVLKPGTPTFVLYSAIKVLKTTRTHLVTTQTRWTYGRETFSRGQTYWVSDASPICSGHPDTLRVMWSISRWPLYPARNFKVPILGWARLVSVNIPREFVRIWWKLK